MLEPSLLREQVLMTRGVPYRDPVATRYFIDARKGRRVIMTPQSAGVVRYHRANRSKSNRIEENSDD